MKKSIEFTEDASYTVATVSGKGRRMVHKKGSRLIDIEPASAERWVRRNVAEYITANVEGVAPTLPPAAPTLPPAAPVGEDVFLVTALEKIRDNALDPQRRTLVYQGLGDIVEHVENLDLTDDSRMVLDAAVKEFAAEGVVKTVDFADIRDAVTEVVGNAN